MNAEEKLEEIKNKLVIVTLSQKERDYVAFLIEYAYYMGKAAEYEHSEKLVELAEKVSAKPFKAQGK